MAAPATAWAVERNVGPEAPNNLLEELCYERN